MGRAFEPHEQGKPKRIKANKSESKSKAKQPSGIQRHMKGDTLSDGANQNMLAVFYLKGTTVGTVSPRVVRQ